ncbi:hypothetical protein Dimus_036665, partial [Dionaea muscipula]
PLRDYSRPYAATAIAVHSHPMLLCTALLLASATHDARCRHRRAHLRHAAVLAPCAMLAAAALHSSFRTSPWFDSVRRSPRCGLPPLHTRLLPYLRDSAIVARCRLARRTVRFPMRVSRRRSRPIVNAVAIASARARAAALFALLPSMTAALAAARPPSYVVAVPHRRG